MLSPWLTAIISLIPISVSLSKKVFHICFDIWENMFFLCFEYFFMKIFPSVLVRVSPQKLDWGEKPRIAFSSSWSIFLLLFPSVSVFSFLLFSPAYGCFFSLFQAFFLRTFPSIWGCFKTYISSSFESVFLLSFLATFNLKFELFDAACSRKLEIPERKVENRN